MKPELADHQPKSPSSLRPQRRTEKPFTQGENVCRPFARLYTADVPQGVLTDLPTPAILIDADVVRRNLSRMADYAASHGLRLRPHTKTHKSRRIGKMQLDSGAAGLTVAKPGEARVMAEVADDVLMAYPAVDPVRAGQIAELAAAGKTIRVALDSTIAADVISDAASSANTTVGVLVDIDAGLHRTGVQSPSAALALAQHVSRKPGLRLDGLMLYPGHIGGGGASEQVPQLKAIDDMLGEVLALWSKNGFKAEIVSGGSTPTAYQSHHVTRLTEIRPGTYVYNDMNCVNGGFGITLDDCAARIVCTVMSDAVPGQIVVDAGSKTLAQDRCGPAPDSGFGCVVELPGAMVTRLSEEHGQVDVTRVTGRIPRVGERVTIVPNHICPCINLQDRVYWVERGDVRPLDVDARGRVI
jgi:D-serine deaminase-like pyridoxal phosphate-dependent protein